MAALRTSPTSQKIETRFSIFFLSSDVEEEDEILSFSVVPSYYKSKLNNGKKDSATAFWLKQQFCNSYFSLN